jgi:hypothetical protein
METVQVDSTLSSDAADVWDFIGAFGDLDVWHPWVPNCTISSNGRTRTIDLGTTKAVESLVGPPSSEFAHTYVVEESPMPVTNYRATLRVDSLDQGCLFVWKAEFEASDASATGLIQRFFESGLAALKARFE